MKPITIIVALLAVVGMVVFVGAPAVFAEDTVRIGRYVASLPGFTGAHKYLPNYHPNWQHPCDLGTARVTIKTQVDFLPGCTEAHGFLPDYHPDWQRPAKVEVVKSYTEKYTAQMPDFGAEGVIYMEPELYIEH